MNYKDLGNPYQTERLQLYNCDCMELLRQTPDNYYQLCIADPPYGIGISSNPVRKKHAKKNWDNSIPDAQYFKELQRVSQHQIIWGGNYFIDHLQNTQGFIIWDKIQPHDFSLAMCELAWTSIQSPAKIFKRSVLAETDKIHVCQKPITLYRWLLANYAKAGDKILDTHLGSMSIAIACHYAGYNLTGCELDPNYFTAGIERVKRETAQMDMFADAPKAKAIETPTML